MPKEKVAGRTEAVRPATVVILVASCLFVVTASFLLFRLRRNSGEGTDVSPMEDDAGRPPELVPSLRHEFRTHPRRVSLFPVTAPAVDDSVVRERMSAEAGNRRQSSEEVAGSLDRRAETERPDLAWATPMEGALTSDVYAAGIAGVSVLNARCGATLCRITLQHQGKPDGDAVSAALGGREAFSGGAYFNHDSRTGRTTVYVARPGTFLFGTRPPIARHDRR